MSITVRDCLNLPSLSFGKVSAGEAGLEKIVSSVSVEEFYDFFDLDVFTHNEIVISAFYNLKDDVDSQYEAIKELADTGAVALVLFYVGKILPRIDKRLKRLADELEFPIIEITGDSGRLKYSDVISDVMTAVINDRNTSQDFVNSTKKRLQQLPLELRNIENLLNMIADHYKCSILLTGPSQLYFCSSYQPAFGPSAPEFFWSQFHGSPLGYEMKDVMTDDKLMHIYKTDFSHSGSTGNTRLTLYVSCFNTELDESILSDMCICIQFFSTVWGYSLELASPETLLSLIFKTSRNAANHYLKISAIPFERIANLIIVSPGNKDILVMKESLAKRFAEYGKFFLCAVIDSQIIILTSMDFASSMDNSLTDDLWQLAGQYDEEASFFMSGANKDLTSLKRTFSDYSRSLPALKKIFRNRRNRDIHDIMLCREIIALSEQQSKKTEYLSQIIDALKDDGDDLLETLSVYLLDCDSRLNLAAKKLFLHRNTVAYRLNKVRQLTNTDFSLMPAAYDFYTAMALWRYQKV